MASRSRPVTGHSFGSLGFGAPGAMHTSSRKAEKAKKMRTNTAAIPSVGRSNTVVRRCRKIELMANSSISKTLTQAVHYQHLNGLREVAGVKNPPLF